MVGMLRLQAFSLSQGQECRQLRYHFCPSFEYLSRIPVNPTQLYSSTTALAQSIKERDGSEASPGAQVLTANLWT